MSKEPLPKCPTCGGPAQRCGSIYYPKYTIHCMKCGRSTNDYPSAEDAEFNWRHLSDPIFKLEGESSC